MAISRLQPLLLLLVLFFFLPALFAIDFEYCNKSGYKFGNITQLEYTLKPGHYWPTVTIHGTTNSTDGGIELGRAELLFESNGSLWFRKAYELCSIDKYICVIRPGIDFVITLSEIPIYPKKPSAIKWAIALVDRAKDEERRERICVLFDVPFPPPELVSA